MLSLLESVVKLVFAVLNLVLFHPLETVVLVIGLAVAYYFIRKKLTGVPPTLPKL